MRGILEHRQQVLQQELQELKSLKKTPVVRLQVNQKQQALNNIKKWRRELGV